MIGFRAKFYEIRFGIEHKKFLRVNLKCIERRSIPVGFNIGQ